MRKCAFLTMDDMADFVSDDELAVEPLAGLGWQVHFLPWRQTKVPWDQFDLVIIRTTWDYQDDLDHYLYVLGKISQSTRLENNLRIVHWNMHKGYLRDLQRRGIGIVPTLWTEDLSSSRLQRIFEQFSCQELVIKPAVGANADHTYRLRRSRLRSQADQLAGQFPKRMFMAQPFMPAIIEEGEYSLFFFAGAYSHAILKSPQEDDFRVQEEHGGLILSVQPEPLLLQRAQTAVAAIEPHPLYARVDMVRDAENDFVVMELELIEPSLYLRMDNDAPHRFASAVASWMRK